MMAVLIACKLPLGFRLFVEAIYAQNDVFIQLGGAAAWLFSIRAGVLQGCALSSSLFTLAINPLLILLQNAVGPRGSIRAFADDIAIVVWMMCHMANVAACFGAFGKPSRLDVKSTKMYLATIGRPAHY